MNIVDEYFWKAQLALQTNRLIDSCTFIYQAIEQLNQNQLTLEQIDLLWSVVPSSSLLVFFFVKINLIYVRI